MVEDPARRKGLLREVHLMADPDEAHAVWVEGRLPEGYHFDSFHYAITFFFDLSALDRKDQIGITLKNEEEWEMMQELLSKMGAVLDAVGHHAPDDEYLSHDKWNDVVTAARNVLAIWVDDE